MQDPTKRLPEKGTIFKIVTNKRNQLNDEFTITAPARFVPRGNSNKAAARAAVIVLTSIVILYHYRVEIKNKLGLGEAPVGGGIAKLKGKAQSTKV